MLMILKMWQVSEELLLPHLFFRSLLSLLVKNAAHNTSRTVSDRALFMILTALRSMDLIQASFLACWEWQGNIVLQLTAVIMKKLGDYLRIGKLLIIIVSSLWVFRQSLVGKTQQITLSMFIFYQNEWKFTITLYTATCSLKQEH